MERATVVIVWCARCAHVDLAESVRTHNARACAHLALMDSTPFDLNAVALTEPGGHT